MKYIKRFLISHKKKEKHSRMLFDKKDEKWEISNIFILILQTKLRARAWNLRSTDVSNKEIRYIYLKAIRCAFHRNILHLPIRAYDAVPLEIYWRTYR